MTDCKEWNGSRNYKGYGIIRSKGKLRFAHRLAYCEANRVTEDEIKGKVIMHMCDNPACVNPEHLKAGTIQDNNNDCIQKGRNVKGKIHGMSKLTEQAVKDIRENKNRLSAIELAEIYNVRRETIYDVLHKRTWNHIKDDEERLQKQFDRHEVPWSKVMELAETHGKGWRLAGWTFHSDDELHAFAQAIAREQSPQAKAGDKS